ncbi:MAG: metal ABC transporter permease [Verrucomicrobiales bacterium]
MMNYLLEPFSLGFMRQALLALALVSLGCGVIGVYVVQRRMAFIGDAMAHTMLPGVVLAYFAGFNLLIGALVAGIVTAAFIGLLSRKGDLREDAAIGVVFTGMFALGILMMSQARSFRDFTHMLFGNILAVSVEDIMVMVPVTLTVLLVLALLHKELQLTTYDPNYAQVIGLSPDLLRYVLLVLLAMTITICLQAVGVILTTALLITPASAAGLISRCVLTTMGLAVVFATLSGLIGLVVSYHHSVPSGASIVLACTSIMLLCLMFKRLRQLFRSRPVNQI